MLELVVDPGGELGLGQSHRVHAHVGVAQAAELGARSCEAAHLVGLDDPGVHPARDGVALAVEPGDPERVDDVAGGRVELHVAAHRNDHLAGSDEVRLGGSVGAVEEVLVLPPPLLTHHDYLHVGVRRPVGSGVHVVEAHQGGEAHHQDHDHQDGRSDGPPNFEVEVAVGLVGELLVG